MNIRTLFAAFTALAAIAFVNTIRAQELEPPAEKITEATVSMPTRNFKDYEKRCDMVQELSEKCGMNYRLLSMKMMEQWQSSIKADKSFLKNMMRGDTMEFTIEKDGSFEFRGTDPKSKNKKTPAKSANSKSSDSQTSKSKPPKDDQDSPPTDK